MEAGNEATKVAETSSEGVEGQPVEQGVTATDHLVDDVVRRDTHQRVLKESREYKARLKETQARLESLENEKLEAQENWKGLAEKYQAKSSEMEKQLAALQVQTALTPKLAEEGCVNIPDALTLGNAELLVSDEGQLHGVEEFVHELKQSKPYLFKTGKPSSVNNAIPSGGLKVEPKGPDTSQMSTKDLKSELAKVAKQLAGR